MSAKQKEEFLKTVLPKRILADLKRDGEELLRVDLTTPQHLDGFMSIIHRMVLLTKDKHSQEEQTLNLMVKVMKGDDAFRKNSLCYIMFPNEMFIYTKVLPCFTQLLEGSGSSVRGDQWCPRVVYGVAGKIPGYSDQFETILVMENMALDGFVSGPRNDLDEQHLTLMARKIAQFHACTYAMKVNKDERLQALVEGILPFEFSKGDTVMASYAAMYRLALRRIFKYVDKHPETLDNDKFKSDFNALRSKHGDEPVHLMQKFLERDDYSVILHGDYNRNNVLFKYENGKPVDLRMFDFQENRYGTPAIDLIFFMCMSMPTGLRERFWYPLLQQYHDSLLTTLRDIFKCNENDPRLEPYSYDNIMKHLNRFALYGGIVAVQFLPWMISPEEECAQLSFYFEKDFNSPEMEHWTQVAGGEAVDQRLIETLRFLSQEGCFSIVHEN